MFNTERFSEQIRSLPLDTCFAILNRALRKRDEAKRLIEVRKREEVERLIEADIPLDREIALSDANEKIDLTRCILEEEVPRTRIRYRHTIARQGRYERRKQIPQRTELRWIASQLMTAIAASDDEQSEQLTATITYEAANSAWLFLRNELNTQLLGHPRQ